MTLWATAQGAAGGCAAACPVGSGDACDVSLANGLMSKWKVYFQ